MLEKITYYKVFGDTLYWYIVFLPEDVRDQDYLVKLRDRISQKDLLQDEFIGLNFVWKDIYTQQEHFYCYTDLLSTWHISEDYEYDGEWDDLLNKEGTIVQMNLTV